MSLDSLEECMLCAAGLKPSVGSVRLEAMRVGSGGNERGELMLVQLGITETGQGMWWCLGSSVS